MVGVMVKVGNSQNDAGASIGMFTVVHGAAPFTCVAGAFKDVRADPLPIGRIFRVITRHYVSLVWSFTESVRRYQTRWAERYPVLSRNFRFAVSMSSIGSDAGRFHGRNRRHWRKLAIATRIQIHGHTCHHEHAFAIAMMFSCPDCEWR